MYRPEASTYRTAMTLSRGALIVPWAWVSANGTSSPSRHSAGDLEWLLSGANAPQLSSGCGSASRNYATAPTASSSNVPTSDLAPEQVPSDARLTRCAGCRGRGAGWVRVRGTGAPGHNDHVEIDRVQAPAYRPRR